MAIDIPHLVALTERLQDELLQLRYEICSFIPQEKLDEFMVQSGMDADDDYAAMNVESAAQLAKLLFDVLGIGEGHDLKLTKGGTRASTGKKQLERFKRDHEVVPLVLNYRERSKLINTYTSKLPKLAKFHGEGKCWCGLKHRAESWRVHTELMTTRTSTGRLASKNPNLQNVSVRSALGREVRAAFTATSGMVIVGADYSQVEMRLGGHYSRDKNLLRIFNENLDPHTETAKLVFKTDSPDKLTQRDPCKNVNFGIFYGLTPEGLFELIALTYATAGLPLPEWLTVEWCAELIANWFGEYEGVKVYLATQSTRALRYGVVWTLMGRIRRVPEVKSVHKRIVNAGLRQAGNMPIQGTCADIMKLAIAEVQDKVVAEFRANGIECWPLITVHDELLIEVEEDYGEVAKGMMEEVMSGVMREECLVPIVAGAKVMSRWEK